MGSEQVLPSHVLLWHADYFALKAMETLQPHRNFCPSHNYLQESKLRALPRMGVITRDKLL